MILDPLAWIESITEKFFVIEVEYFTEGLFHSSSVEIIGAQVLEDIAKVLSEILILRFWF